MWWEKATIDTFVVVQHLDSFAHRGKTIEYPTCDRLFKTSNGLVHHVETGSCTGAWHVNLKSIHGWAKEKFPSLTTKASPRLRHRDASALEINKCELECPDCDRKFIDKVAWNNHISSQARKSHPRRNLCLFMQHAR